MSNTNRTQRLRFRSWHRGMREMDLLMGSFADKYLPGFTDAQLDQYEQILEYADPDLYNWIIGTAPLPEEHRNGLMLLLLAHRHVKE